jgi:hypothetical protein
MCAPQAKPRPHHRVKLIRVRALPLARVRQLILATQVVVLPVAAVLALLMGAAPLIRAFV